MFLFLLPIIFLFLWKLSPCHGWLLTDFLSNRIQASGRKFQSVPETRMSSAFSRRPPSPSLPSGTKIFAVEVKTSTGCLICYGNCNQDFCSAWKQSTAGTTVLPPVHSEFGPPSGMTSTCQGHFAGTGNPRVSCVECSGKTPDRTVCSVHPPGHLRCSAPVCVWVGPISL